MYHHGRLWGQNRFFPFQPPSMWPDFTHCVKSNFTGCYLQDMSMSMAGMALMAPLSRIASENIVSWPSRFIHQPQSNCDANWNLERNGVTKNDFPSGSLVFRSGSFIWCWVLLQVEALLPIRSFYIMYHGLIASLGLLSAHFWI